MSVLWATRGRTWGFRFLRDGGLPDPLGAYEAAFSAVPDEHEAFRRNGDTVALRFPDPLGRQDGAGRVIPHEFVVTGPVAAEVHSLQAGRELVWPMVAEEYGRVWAEPTPPPR